MTNAIDTSTRKLVMRDKHQACHCKLLGPGLRVSLFHRYLDGPIKHTWLALAHPGAPVLPLLKSVNRSCRHQKVPEMWVNGLYSEIAVPWHWLALRHEGRFAGDYVQSMYEHMYMMSRIKRAVMQ